MCDNDATAGTAYVDGKYFLLCDKHLGLWQRTPDDISLIEWCDRITTLDVEIGKTWFCDYIDSLGE